VAGNGDIGSAEEMLHRAGEWDAVMIGRLAVTKPWIFAEAQNMRASLGTVLPRSVPNPLITIEETGLRFLELLARHQPPEFHLSRGRRFFHYFCDNLVWGNYVKNLLNREKTLSGIERAWRNYFAEYREERSPGVRQTGVKAQGSV
jgi:tRNA-dihydrouridine synthase